MKRLIFYTSIARNKIIDEDIRYPPPNTPFFCGGSARSAPIFIFSFAFFFLHDLFDQPKHNLLRKYTIFHVKPEHIHSAVVSAVVVFISGFFFLIVARFLWPQTEIHRSNSFLRCFKRWIPFFLGCEFFPLADHQKEIKEQFKTSVFINIKTDGGWDAFYFCFYETIRKLFSPPFVSLFLDGCGEWRWRNNDIIYSCLYVYIIIYGLKEAEWSHPINSICIMCGSGAG